jgi:hypothetical protein
MDRRMSWSELEDQVQRRKAEFWWRDDDASTASPALKRALDLSSKHRLPLALAVIPEAAQPDLFGLLHDRVTVLQHGTDHRNRAAAGEKKTEYPGHEPLPAALARIGSGMDKLRGQPGFLPVLTPPWNRIRKDLLDKLPGLGIRGISLYGAQPRREAAPGLPQVNTHVDIVAWRAGRRFIGEQQAIAQAIKWLAVGGPVGWLTHHAMHDGAAWDFLERLFTLRGVRWLSAAEAFSYTGSANG